MPGDAEPVDTKPESSSLSGMMPRRVLILIGHTGSGHLRAAEAVREGLRRRYPEGVRVEIVDALGEYAPFPYNRLADFYPWWVTRAPGTWHWGYRLTDGARRATAVLRTVWPHIWPRMRRLLQRHSADAIVSAHPLTNHYLVWALRRLNRATPALTLVTDPVNVHPFWLAPGIDRCLVGSETARHKAWSCGLRPDQVRLTGLPVNPRFVDGLLSKAEARRRLGWSVVQPAVVLMGGGQGVGRLYRTARAIDTLCPEIQLAVVTGHNHRLRQHLKHATWRSAVRVYGFLKHSGELPCLMSAADLLVTKAGPGTLHEAFLAGLPLVLNEAIPGQEEGNVRLVVEGGAGVWAPDPDDAAGLVARWLRTEREALLRVAANSRALARPDAAEMVAQEAWQLALTNL